MSSFIRRLSASIPGTGTSPPSDTESTTSFFRRKSSATSIPEDSNSSEEFRSLGARDYKLALTPSEQEAARRSSIADMAEGFTAAETSTSRGADAEAQKKERKGSSGRIYGARDWRLIGKE